MDDNTKNHENNLVNSKTLNNTKENKMYQNDEYIKTEIDVIEDNIFESIVKRENNSTILEDITEEPMENHSYINNKNTNHIQPQIDAYNPDPSLDIKYDHLIKNNRKLFSPLVRCDEKHELFEKKIKSEYIDDPKHEIITDIKMEPTKPRRLNITNEIKMYQNDEYIKTEIDVIEDNTFECIVKRENNSSILEDITEEPMENHSYINNKNTNHIQPQIDAYNPDPSLDIKYDHFIKNSQKLSIPLVRCDEEHKLFEKKIKSENMNDLKHESNIDFTIEPTKPSNLNNSMENKTFQGHKYIKTEIDIIEGNIFESIFTSENDSTIEEQTIKNPIEDFRDLNNINTNNLKPKKIDGSIRNGISYLDGLNTSKRKKTCQGHENVKTEIDIIEDNTFENIFSSENNEAIKEEFYSIHNKNRLYSEKNDLSTGNRDQFSCLNELNSSKKKKYQSDEDIVNKKDTINKNRYESENNDTMKINPEVKKTKPKQNYKQRTHTFKESFMNISNNEKKVKKCDNFKTSFVRKNNSIPRLRTSNRKKLNNCTVCKKSFTGTEDLKRHMSIHTGKNSFECTVCEKPFNHQGSLNRHMRIHTGEKPYECTVCEKSFTQKVSLKLHMRIHTGEKPYECTVCDKSFNRQGTLKLHMRIHTGGKRYECTVCEKSFSHQGSLYRHIRIHTGEKPHECTICEKTFNRQEHLKLHMRNHVGEKPYECTVCEKSFNHQGSLNRHMRIHTGEKPYECTVCEKTFNRQEALKLHMRIHTGEKPYECTVCEKSFNQQGNLKLHMRIHTGGNAYTCAVCKKSFRQKRTLSQHIRNHTETYNT